MSNEPTVKLWTAKRKAAVVMAIFKGQTTVTEVARENDLTVSEVESWTEEAPRNMENGFLSRPRISASSMKPNFEKLGKQWARLICRFMH